MEVLGFVIETMAVLLLLVGWFVLMRFVLPRLGIST
jgi:p-aminobenzoyl-glutamate transporter AbgT